MYTLITGSSSGIGKALALECAAKGMNLLLVALPGDELDQLACLIHKQYNVKCHTFGVDLAQHCASSKVYDWVMQKGYKVNILINNVGLGSKGPFEDSSTDFYYTQIYLNIVAVCMLTRLFIDELKKNAPSHIMNTGSMGGFFLLPHKAVYSASKAFVYSFSRSLRMELKSSRITVSVLCPGGTDSNHKTRAINKDLKGIARASILQPSQVAAEAIPKMLKGQARIIPGLINKIYFHVSWIVPAFVKNYLVLRAFKHVNSHKY
ncbi:MAG TPA: SDR family NAD(P)-dependent oxidoreductase [Chitinophagaceae bacterium]|nr:SDR family NAD(P)-dependent oxidoreductase [Chitinophagaceae bacterium]